VIFPNNATITLLIGEILWGGARRALAVGGQQMFSIDSMAAIAPAAEEPPAAEAEDTSMT